jgi:cytochrome c5
LLAHPIPLPQETRYNPGKLQAYHLQSIDQEDFHIMNTATRLMALVFGLIMSTSALAVSERQQEEILERIKPVGEVCLEGDASCAGAVAAAPAGAAAKSGDEVYSSSCNACHASGAAGAPKVGDAGAWSARVAKGIDALYGSAINGFQGMPAKGLCMSCSDDELKAAVDYMVENSK